MQIEPVPALAPAPASPTDPTFEYRRAARSERTWRAYEFDWADFRGWCQEHGEAPVPPDAQVVCRYLVALAADGLRPATIRRRLAALSVVFQATGHPTVTKERVVLDTMAGIARSVGVAQRQATPATTREIRKMCQAMPDTPHGVRDRAVILLGFAAALRRSELAALDVRDLRFVDAGIEVTVRRSKTDQIGAGQVVPVPFGGRVETCPVRSVKAWISLLARELDPETTTTSWVPRVDSAFEGPLFRAIRPDGWISDRHLDDRSVSRIVERAAHRADLDPAGVWTGHSLRAGLATSAARAGVPDRVIMATTRHRSRATLDRYIREGKRWDQVAAASVGL